MTFSCKFFFSKMQMLDNNLFNCVCMPLAGMYVSFSITSNTPYVQPQKLVSCAVALLLYLILFAFGIFSSCAAMFTHSVRQFKEICRVKSLLTS